MAGWGLIRDLDIVPLLSCVPERERRGAYKGSRSYDNGSTGAPKKAQDTEDPKTLEDWLSPGEKSTESRKLMA